MLNLFNFPFGALVLQILLGAFGAGLVLLYRRGFPRAWTVAAVLIAGIAGAFIVDFVIIMFALPLCGTSCAQFDADTLFHGLLTASFLGAAGAAWMTAQLTTAAMT